MDDLFFLFFRFIRQDIDMAFSHIPVIGEKLGLSVMPRAAPDLLAVQVDDVFIAHPVVVDSHKGAHHDRKQDEDGEEGRQDIGLEFRGCGILVFDGYLTGLGKMREYGKDDEDDQEAARHTGCCPDQGTSFLLPYLLCLQVDLVGISVGTVFPDAELLPFRFRESCAKLLQKALLNPEILGSAKRSKESVVDHPNSLPVSGFGHEGIGPELLLPAVLDLQDNPVDKAMVGVVGSIEGKIAVGDIESLPGPVHLAEGDCSVGIGCLDKQSRKGHIGPQCKENPTFDPFREIAEIPMHSHVDQTVDGEAEEGKGEDEDDHTVCDIFPVVPGTDVRLGFHRYHPFHNTASRIPTKPRTEARGTAILKLTANSQT